MSIIFKKLLPRKLQDTRWGEFIDVFQSIIDNNLKPEKINPIFTQYDLNNSTDEEKLNIAKTFGFNLLTLTGYTSTSYYLKKQIETIVNRIKFKNSKASYAYTGYVYDLLSSAYPLKLNSEGYLANKLNTVYNTEEQIVYAVTSLDQEGDNLLYKYNDPVYTLDLGQTLDSSEFIIDKKKSVYATPIHTGLSLANLDSFEFPTLNVSTGQEISGGDLVVLSNITRNIIFYYEHKFIENISEFLSLNTLKVLKNDINQIKKATEVIYYEPLLDITTYSNTYTPYTKTYIDYTDTISVNQYNMLLKDNLYDIKYAEFGIGSQDISSGVVSGVQTYSFQYPPTISGVIQSGLINYFTTSGLVIFDFIIEEKNKFTEFTELALYDSSDDLLLYSTFPKIQWDSEMYNNLQCKITLV